MDRVGVCRLPAGTEGQGKVERIKILMGQGAKQRGIIEASQNLSSTLFELCLMIISPFHT